MTEPENINDLAIAEMLNFDHWVIAGLRDSQIRPAWGVARYLQSLGRHI